MVTRNRNKEGLVKKSEYWWVRCGVYMPYSRFDTIAEAVGNIIKCGAHFPVRRTTEHGVYDQFLYTSHNYISIFLGDQNGEPAKRLSNADIERINRIARES